MVRGIAGAAAVWRRVDPAKSVLPNNAILSWRG